MQERLTLDLCLPVSLLRQIVIDRVTPHIGTGVRGKSNLFFEIIVRTTGDESERRGINQSKHTGHTLTHIYMYNDRLQWGRTSQITLRTNISATGHSTSTSSGSSPTLGHHAKRLETIRTRVHPHIDTDGKQPDDQFNQPPFLSQSHMASSTWLQITTR